jgi:integrase
MEKLNIADISLLNHAHSNGIIDLTHVLEQSEKLKRKEILKQYRYKYLGKEDRWYWYKSDPTQPHGREKIRRKKKEDLEQRIIKYHLSHVEAGLLTSPSVSRMFDDYAKTAKKEQSVLATSINRYKNYFDKYIASSDLADIEITNVTEKDIKSLLDGIIKGKVENNRITKKTFNDIKAVINNIFAFAKSERDLDCISTKSYMLDLKYSKRHFKPTKKRDEECVYSEQELNVICDYIIGRYRKDSNDVRELGILFCFVTGLRSGELSCLKTSDLTNYILYVTRHLSRDENSKYIIVDGVKEGEDIKKVYLSDTALTVWNWLLKVNLKNSNPTEYVFYDDNMPVHKHLVTHHFDTTLRKICKKLEIPFRSPHKMRATYISKSIDNGANPTDIQRNVGHKDLSTTMNNYYHTTKSHEQLRNDFNRAESLVIPA